MIKDEIVDYVRNSPHNTNPAVIESLVDSYGEEVGGVGKKGIGENSNVFNGIAPEKASGDASHAEGQWTAASGAASHAEGASTTASGTASHAEGAYTTASSAYQHVQGQSNIDDPIGKYAHIVGNGEFKTRSNAHTLDWQGNSWYQGSVLVGGTNMDAPDAEFRSDSVIIKSSTPGSVKRFKITVTDDGVIKATQIYEEAGPN